MYFPSIIDNVTLSNYENRLKEEKIIEALDRARIKEIVSNAKNGLDSEVSKEFCDDGLELSGGQKQKITHSRFFFSSGNIRILDEPTSSLDKESEKHFFDTIYKSRAGNITIIISHRFLDIMKYSNKIIFLDNGRIVEQGNHKELIKKKEKYYNFINKIK